MLLHLYICSVWFSSESQTEFKTVSRIGFGEIQFAKRKGKGSLPPSLSVFFSLEASMLSQPTPLPSRCAPYQPSTMPWPNLRPSHMGARSPSPSLWLADQLGPPIDVTPPHLSRVGYGSDSA
jgi:hypothetical protein